ncbi:hypothetical protein EMIHUDRAFT_446858 [Emiliania huxleyi CCMP1516]|uniref:Uncharacterized protein n=2 Tax=Emiliania huxleyi TaxID=2903 RepID=A0A0D3KTL7_EMIH1|nr:hypothetical protein EMIHUDRAFT_446858 [Emiliania huxleyi CCMP1516]EOD39102.1 hypothetical protein EMIHUDRAFT_446858 [Emiliania huxleyi CCMP1516]|eukprot:XP_005791531.1 hypothetical protein EMIHUDRAFT_446858 [Emiliania huxleyi CCMP1516]
MTAHGPAGVQHGAVRRSDVSRPLARLTERSASLLFLYVRTLSYVCEMEQSYIH